VLLLSGPLVEAGPARARAHPARGAPAPDRVRPRPLRGGGSSATAYGWHPGGPRDGHARLNRALLTLLTPLHSPLPPCPRLPASSSHRSRAPPQLVWTTVPPCLFLLLFASTGSASTSHSLCMPRLVSPWSAAVSSLTCSATMPPCTLVSSLRSSICAIF
jgi:hypothetical protein